MQQSLFLGLVAVHTLLQGQQHLGIAPEFRVSKNDKHSCTTQAAGAARMRVGGWSILKPVLAC